MKAKIQELETALAATRLQPQSEPQSPEDPSSDDLFDQTYSRVKTDNEPSGTLGIDQEGIARYYGENSLSEVSNRHIFQLK